MPITTSLSGNEIYCLAQKKLTPGNIVIGNSVYAIGVMGLLESSLKSIGGGELEQVTSLIEEGRLTSYGRMQAEAKAQGATGITGVTNELIFQSGNIEFLSVGSLVHGEKDQAYFSTSADGQELYAQLDAGYHPISFAFGNVAYAMGIGRGIVGGLKTLARGEIKEYSDMFNHTRHLALERIIQHAKEKKANAVLGIKTTILPFSGVTEMLMIGTASYHADIPTGEIITSDMTNIEMWNMASQGYVPVQLVLGTSVYSLGLAQGVTAIFKRLVRGEIKELTTLIYDARENALALINAQAKAIGADDVVGVKTYVYNLGNGLVEFLAIGTAVKKVAYAKTETPQLPPQAIVVDKDTFYDSKLGGNVTINEGIKNSTNFGLFGGIFWIILIGILYLWLR